MSQDEQGHFMSINLSDVPEMSKPLHFFVIELPVKIMFLPQKRRMENPEGYGQFLFFTVTIRQTKQYMLWGLYRGEGCQSFYLYVDVVEIVTLRLSS